MHGGRELRRAFSSPRQGYVLAVRANTAIAPCPAVTTTAAGAMNLFPDRAWQRLRTGSGTKGVLLIRRHRYTRAVSFYQCWTPGRSRRRA